MMAYLTGRATRTQGAAARPVEGPYQRESLLISSFSRRAAYAAVLAVLLAAGGCGEDWRNLDADDPLRPIGPSAGRGDKPIGIYPPHAGDRADGAGDGTSQPPLDAADGDAADAEAERPPAGYPSRKRLYVPEPINLLLPRRITIHPAFTGTGRLGGKADGPRGLEVRVKALDAYGDPVKAFGDFRFVLYTYRHLDQNPKGQKLVIWDERLLEPKKNQRHWDAISQSYKFFLQWDHEMPPGRRYLLEAFFASPFTDRFFDELVFTSGQ